MKLHVINTGFFKLDGGAMFGVVPKSLWQRTNPADDNNLCTWALRCLLIEDGDKLILIDNGTGDKQSENFFRHYYLHGDDTLEKSILSAGYSPDDVTDVFMTHLHFDHCGGGVRIENDKPVLSFGNATYWSNQAHWEWAVNPNDREKASFLKENLMPIAHSGHLKHIDQKNGSPFKNMEIIFVDGHTEKQMLPKITYKDHTIVFMADLIPSIGHIPLPYVMGYDVRPLVTLKEKNDFLNKAVENNYILYFEHDPVNECCTVKQTEKGVRPDKTFQLSDIL